MYRSRTVVVVVPFLAVRVVATHSMRAPPSAPNSMRASDSSVRSRARVYWPPETECVKRGFDGLLGAHHPGDDSPPTVFKEMTMQSIRPLSR